MEHSETILGLTLAELSLFIVFSMTLLFVIQSRDKTDKEDLQETLAQMQKEKELLEEKLETERTQLRNLKLRSAAKPSCTNERFGMDILFDTVVVAKREFNISGDRYTFRQLRRRYSKQLNEAEKLGCVHRVRVSFRQVLDADAYNDSLKALDTLFYVKKLTAVKD